MFKENRFFVKRKDSDKMLGELGDVPLRPGAWVAVPKGVILREAVGWLRAAQAKEANRYKEIWE